MPIDDFYKNFICGTMSAMTATCCIQPVDMVKVRIQLRSEGGGSTGVMDVVKEIHAKGGVKGFYAGLDSALLRQLVYGTLRLGIYFNCTEYFKKKNGGETTTFGQKAASALFAGSFGSFWGNPCDLVLVRMQADTVLPEAERRNYKGVVDAFQRIPKEEGVAELWRGSVPTMIRATALNMSMMITYDTVKEQMTKMLGNENPFKVQFFSSLIAAVNVAFITLPFDNIKTKIQKQKPLKDGTMPYKNFVDCFQKSLAKEGATGFWAGLPTFYFRVGPHAIIVLLASEQFRKLLGIGQK